MKVYPRPEISFFSLPPILLYLGRGYQLNDCCSRQCILVSLLFWSEDIDECAEGTHQCSPFANCMNTIGDYECVCKEGYTGNGLQCTRKYSGCVCHALLWRGIFYRTPESHKVHVQAVPLHHIHRFQPGLKSQFWIDDGVEQSLRYPYHNDSTSSHMFLGLPATGTQWEFFLC